MLRIVLYLSALLCVAAAPSPYAEGQVWTYKARAQDTGSLVKIQKIEDDPAGPIFHVSLIGIRVNGSTTSLQHAPVSRKTLDESVIRQVADPGSFPDPSEGIAEWRRAQGGVFTISLAQIASMIADTVGKQQGVPVT